MSHAQDAAVTTATEDEVVATGTLRGADAAMDAFLSGDYARAEIEFERNYANLRRGEFLRWSAIDQGQTDALSALSQGGPPPVGAQGGAVQATSSIGQTLSINLDRRKPVDGELISSGDDLGFQLYMAGLSEIQLRKYDQARASMKRALTLNPKLYDARLKLGLLDWQAGDRDGAVKQLGLLERDLKRCKSRCAKNRDLIEAAITPLRDALAKG